MRRKRYKYLGEGNACPKCFKSMDRRGHLEKPKKNWYYIKWDYCKDCGHLQHYEEFKSPEWQEAENNESFFKSLR